MSLAKFRKPNLRYPQGKFMFPNRKAPRRKFEERNIKFRFSLFGHSLLDFHLKEELKNEKEIVTIFGYDIIDVNIYRMWK
jgi:hypothetical protein